MDGGTNWKMLLNDVCNDLVVNNGNFNHIFVAGNTWSSGRNYATFHKSLDGGSTWTHNKFSVESWADAVAIHPSNDNVIYVGGSVASKPTVFKSIDGGSSWSKKILTGGPGLSVNSLAVDPNTPSRLYAGTMWGLFRSVNSGSSWTKKKGDLWVKCLKINPNNPSIIYAGCSDGVYVSTDYGNTWNEFNEGLTIKDVQWLDIDKSHKILYAATAGGGVYKRIL